MIFNRERKLINDIIFCEKKIKNEDFNLVSYEKITWICSNQLMLPALYNNIIKKKYKKKVPIDFLDYISKIYDENLIRNKNLVKEVKQLGKILQEHNIEYVFIKGSALIFSNIFKNLGERMIGDIDFLIREKDKKVVEKIFNVKGIFPIKNSSFFSDRHLRRRIKKNNIFALEPHFKLLSKKSGLIDESTVFKKKQMVNGVFVPALEDIFLINILNNQINEKNFLKLEYNLRCIYDHEKIQNQLKNKSYLPNEKYINTFFYLLKKAGLRKYSNNKYGTLSCGKILRFKIKYSSQTTYKIDKILVRIYLKILLNFRRIKKIFYDKYYRKHVIDKIVD